LQDLPAAVTWLGHRSVSGVAGVLDRLGFSRKQAMLWVRSPDPEYDRKRRAVINAYAAALAQPTTCVVVFLDELTYYRRPTLAPCYHLQGDDLPHVPGATGYNTQTRIVAALNGVSGQVTYWQRSQIGQAQLVGFYHNLRQVYPHAQPVYVVQDNWPVHKLPEVRAAMQAEGLTPVFLPTYASWLNPIEKLWRWLKQDILHTHPYAEAVEQLRQAVRDFLEQFATGSEALLRYTGLLPI
jgi:transposase